jgi:hypothetical protein
LPNEPWLSISTLDDAPVIELEPDSINEPLLIVKSVPELNVISLLNVVPPTNVVVPFTVIMSAPASPKLTAPFSVVTPEIVALDNDDKLETVTAVALIVAIVAVPSTVSDCVSIALPYIFSTFCASVPSVCVLTPLSVNVPLIVVSPPSIEPAVTTMFANVPVLVEPVISPVTPRLPPTVKSPVTLAAPGIFN